jgi:hypothetical protein
MSVIKVRRDGTIKLPQAVRALFPIGSFVSVERSGKSAVLKRSIPPKPSSKSKARGPRVMSIEEVAEEIHDIRRDRRGPRT